MMLFGAIETNITHNNVFSLELFGFSPYNDYPTSSMTSFTKLHFNRAFPSKFLT